MPSRRDFLAAAGALTQLPAQQRTGAVANDAVTATEFESRVVYRSAHKPGYTSWVSFFPGDEGRWYLTCEEVTKPEPPQPRMSPQRYYEFGLPSRMDKSGDRMEIVMLESADQMRTWRVVSRQPVRYQHSAGSFGQARTKDGRFLRFVWQNYSLDPQFHPGEILYVSSDGGATWQRQAPLHDRNFASYPHRLRTLRDGVLALALPLAPSWGQGGALPTRTAVDLNSRGAMQMTLCFSHDEGRTWTQPLPIYGGDVVSETDFTELPNGDLLCINNSIFGYPGRQIIHRFGDKFLPGPVQKVMSGKVPETVAMGPDGVLVGCMRCSQYSWSDDLGLNWYPLAGIPEAIRKSRENYQPWIHHLGEGRFATAGHYGADNFVGEVDQYLTIHFFRVQVQRRAEPTRLELSRDFDAAENRWRNVYRLRLTAGAQPIPDAEIELWYVERNQPGYDWQLKNTLDERMKLGGRTLRARTNRLGEATVAIQELDRIQDPHHSVQLVARFNAGRTDPRYQPAQTPMFENYSNLRY